MEEYNPDLLTLTNDDGEEYTFELLDTIEEEEAAYVALTPCFDDPSGNGGCHLAGADKEKFTHFYLPCDSLQPLSIPAALKRRTAAPSMLRYHENQISLPFLTKFISKASAPKLTTAERETPHTSWGMVNTSVAVAVPLIKP